MKASTVLILSLLGGAALGQAADLPTFRHVTIDDKVRIGYGIAIADMNADKKPDIVLCDARNIAWYQNPSWKKHIIVENLTQRDHVCIAVRDIDGDGRAEIAAGAQWNPGETTDTAKSGAVFYLIPPADRTQKWTPVQLHHEPTTHRMRWFEAPNGSFDLVVLPLHGRGNRANKGEGVRTLAYHLPADPKQAWKTTLVDDTLHASHNFDVAQWDRDKADEMLLSGVEGSFLLKRGKDNSWSRQQISNNPTGEVRQGRGSGGANFVTAIEPMHGSQLSIYTTAIRAKSSGFATSSTTPSIRDTRSPPAISWGPGPIRSWPAGVAPGAPARWASSFTTPPTRLARNGKACSLMTTRWPPRTSACSRPQCRRETRHHRRRPRLQQPEDLLQRINFGDGGKRSTTAFEWSNFLPS